MSQRVVVFLNKPHESHEIPNQFFEIVTASKAPYKTAWQNIALLVKKKKTAYLEVHVISKCSK